MYMYFSAYPPPEYSGGGKIAEIYSVILFLLILIVVLLILVLIVILAVLLIVFLRHNYLLIIHSELQDNYLQKAIALLRESVFFLNFLFYSEKSQSKHSRKNSGNNKLYHPRPLCDGIDGE